MSVTVQHGVGVKPPGDVVTVHVLNAQADAVLVLAAGAQQHRSISIVTSQLESVIDPDHQALMSGDTDDTIWEEMEESVRHQSRVTANYLMAMACGGGIAAIGLVADAVPQAISFVAAAVIATGFEPIVKLPMAAVFGRWDVAKHGLRSMGIGYGLLILAAALTFFVLRVSGDRTVDQLIHNGDVQRLAHPTLSDVLRSGLGALAGVMMIAAGRWYVIAGPLMALELIPAAALVGTALLAGQPMLAGRGLLRLGIDVALIILLGLLLLRTKQARVHHHRPQPMVSMAANAQSTEGGLR